MKILPFLITAALGTISVVSAGGCPNNYLRNYTLPDLAIIGFYYVNQREGLLAELRNRDCVRTIGPQFFISADPRFPGWPDRGMQRLFLGAMFGAMGPYIQHIPPGAFRGLVADNDDCIALEANVRDGAVRRLLARYLSRDQLEAIHANCGGFFTDEFRLDSAYFDRWHLIPGSLNWDLDYDWPRFAPKIWVEQRFDVAFCQNLTADKLRWLGHDIFDLELRGTKGISNRCLKAIPPAVWAEIAARDAREATVPKELTRIVRELNVEAFQNMDIQLPEDVIAQLTAPQLAAYDVVHVGRPRCQHLNLNIINDEHSGSLEVDCFTGALRSAAVNSVNLAPYFLERARDDLFSQLVRADLNKFTQVTLTQPALKKTYMLHIWGLVKGDITANMAILRSIAPRWAQLHDHNDFNPILEMKMENIQKLPRGMLNGEGVLQKLGPTKIKALKVDQPEALPLYHRAEFKKAVTPSQFTQLFCKSDSNCGTCGTVQADSLFGINRPTLKSITSSCLSKMANWGGLTPDHAKEVIPYLSDRAFEVVSAGILPQAVLEVMRGAQLAEFDSKEKDSPCDTLPLGPQFPLRLVKSLRPKCFATAYTKNPAVVLPEKFIARAKNDLLNELDSETAEPLLKEAKFWAALSNEQIKQMLTKDVNYCAGLKAAPKGKSLSLPPLSPDCVKLIDPDELVALLSSSAVKAFQEDSLKAVTSDAKDVEKILKPLSTSRPELLKHLGVDSESDNPCSLLEIQKVTKDYASAAKYLQKNCYAAMTGLDEIKLVDLKKLPEAAQEAIPVKDIIEHMESNNEFEDLKESEWNTYMGSTAFCKAASSEILHKNKKFIDNLTGPCYSALSFDLDDKETKALSPSVITHASDDVVAKHVTKYTPAQIGLLSANIKKVASLNALSIEQIAAVPTAAMKHVNPNALTDIDTAHFQAILPETFGAMTFDQLAKVPRNVIITITPDQARNLGKHVEDKLQDPRRLFTADLHGKLSPEVQKLITVASGAHMVQTGVIEILFIAVITATAVLA